MRTREFIDWWFAYFNILQVNTAPRAEEDIVQRAIEKIALKGKPKQGVAHIFNFFIERNFKIGLASSSPMRLIEVVVDRLGIRKHLHAMSSAAELPYGKPQPMVYLNCAWS
jgi:sugar-phosphatase